jgi:hypothetical protein
MRQRKVKIVGELQERQRRLVIRVKSGEGKWIFGVQYERRADRKVQKQDKINWLFNLRKEREEDRSYLKRNARSGEC